MIAIRYAPDTGAPCESRTVPVIDPPMERPKSIPPVWSGSITSTSTASSYVDTSP